MKTGSLEGLLSRALVLQNSCICSQADILDAKVATQDNGAELRGGPRRSLYWGHGPLVWDLYLTNQCS